MAFCLTFPPKLFYYFVCLSIQFPCWSNVFCGTPSFPSVLGFCIIEYMWGSQQLRALKPCIDAATRGRGVSITVWRAGQLQRRQMKCYSLCASRILLAMLERNGSVQTKTNKWLIWIWTLDFNHLVATCVQVLNGTAAASVQAWKATVRCILIFYFLFYFIFFVLLRFNVSSDKQQRKKMDMKYTSNSNTTATATTITAINNINLCHKSFYFQIISTIMIAILVIIIIMIKFIIIVELYRSFG